MKRISILFSALTFIIILGTSSISSVQYSSTPPAGKTGATGNYCTSCHSSFGLNVGGGNVTTTGLPSGYAANATYSFSVVITHGAADRKRWGFAIKAVDASGSPIGIFTTTNSNTTVNGSRELTHSSATNNAASNTYTYANLKWKAPASNPLTDKKVRFFLVAVAGFGGGSSGDYVYSKLITVPIAVATSISSFTPTKSRSEERRVGKEC